MFQTEDQFLILPINDPEIIYRVERALIQNGFRVMQTFQLRGSSDPEFKRDPDNASMLVFQITILLVFGRMPDPITLVIQIDRNLTKLSVVKTFNTTSFRYLENKIIKTLISTTCGIIQTDDSQLSGD